MSPSSTFIAWAKDANVDIEIKGKSNEKQIPLAAETPIRSPVKEPGPLLTAIASISLNVLFADFKTSSTNT